MKKGKRSVMESSPASTYYPVTEEAKARFRHHSLLQDYEDLLKETEAKRKKLQNANEKKLRLLVEVKFLRRKYKCLSVNPSGKTPFRLNKKPRSSQSPLLLTGRPSIPFFQLPAKDQSFTARDATTPSTAAVIDLNQVSLPVGEEMDEYQISLEPAKADNRLRKSPVEGDAMANDLKLSICRDVGHGSNQVVKRKITWQDQVALRV
ncbi:hypothetical protein OPV22_010611 [Ensete ventricosum]|uniref:Uncharacterized protein n=1 Tax=Ensete ventricosum TaxID=4639 RepID=A0AAV8RDG9_ENSVE|nr:hypothetical protein OPV22_010611 [Ensete ventricosum]